MKTTNTDVELQLFLGRQSYQPAQSWTRMLAARGLLPTLRTMHELHRRHADRLPIGSRVQLIPRCMTDLERKVDAALSVE